MLARKNPRSSQALHHRHLAFHHLCRRATWPVTHRIETISKHGSSMLGCGWLSGLLRHSHRDWHGTTAKPRRQRTPLHVFSRELEIAPTRSESVVASPVYSPFRQVSMEASARTHVMDLGWTSDEPDKWKSPTGDW